ncbi:MAG: endonuclease/exonuclease/phosphatase family protein [Pseudomonadota bacterium]
MRIFSRGFVCISASIGLILCLLAGKFWIADLAIHWRLHMAVVSLFFALVFLFKPRKILAVWMLALAIGFALPAYQVFSPAPIPEGTEKARIKILQFNILYINDEFKKTIPWIIEQNADIVVLQEITEPRANELTELKKHYSWSQIRTNDKRRAFGMAIFSKLPVKKFDYIDIGDGWNHYTRTEFSVNNLQLNLYELHTPPPVSEHFFELRNQNLSVLADVMSKDESPHRILIGDMNSTIYSPYLQNVLTSAKLYSNQQNYNMEGTWPSFLPVPLRIGIDHVIASKQIKIENREIAKEQNSDHLPIITTLSLYE